MSDEKLTEEELAYLCSEDVGSPAVIKALRIIEKLTTKCDAQAAALDRVRAALAGPTQPGETLLLIRNAVYDYLPAADRQRAWDEDLAGAPAPEATGGGAADISTRLELSWKLDVVNAKIAELHKECTNHVLGWSKCQGRLDAASARIAELERLARASADCAFADVTAANARIAALEAESDGLHIQCDKLASDFAVERRAKNAANARAEAAEREMKQQESERVDAIGAMANAESEAAALRAEVERLRGELLNMNCVAGNCYAETLVLKRQYDTAFKERAEAEKLNEQLKVTVVSLTEDLAYERAVKQKIQNITDSTAGSPSYRCAFAVEEIMKVLDQ